MTYSENGLQGGQDETLVIGICEAISLKILGDVGDEFVEKCDLEKLVEGDEL